MNKAFLSALVLWTCGFAAPVQAVWTDVAELSTATLTWTDLASAGSYYYEIRAVNNSGRSDHSVILTPGTPTAFAVAPDDQRPFEVRLE